jgi:hypothetical protein
LIPQSFTLASVQLGEEQVHRHVIKVGEPPERLGSLQHSLLDLLGDLPGQEEEFVPVGVENLGQPPD